MAKELQNGVFRSLLPFLVAGVVSIDAVTLRGQSAPAAPLQPSSPEAVPSAGGAPTGTAPVAVPAPAAVVPAPAVPSSAAAKAAAAATAATQMIAALDRLKAQGKLTSNRSVSAAVRQVVKDNSVNHEMKAPVGAKVLAVHKHAGEYVRVGDKIVTLEVDGKPMPILAQQAGIMQTINFSKGGVIGNSRPRAAQAATEEAEGELILISPITLFTS
jgi:biotin carboxyl carrier protein